MEIKSANAYFRVIPTPRLLLASTEQKQLTKLALVEEADVVAEVGTVNIG